MFEAAELGRRLPKDAFKAQVPPLRAELLDVQRRLREAPAFATIVIFAGVDLAGKGETVNLLNEWMDPRWIVTRAYDDPSAEELERPEYWRYWRDLPPNGRIGLYLSSWYSRPILDRVYGNIGMAKFDRRLEHIKRFEQALADDGTLIVKFWMHLGKREQKKRLTTFEHDPDTRWRVTKRQWKHWHMYARFIGAAEVAIRRTSTGSAPWTIVEGFDEPYRSLTVATTLRDAIRKRLAASVHPSTRSASPGSTVSTVELSTRRTEAKDSARTVTEGPIGDSRQLSTPPRGSGVGGDRPDFALRAPSRLVEASRRRPTRTILSGLDMSQQVAKRDFNQTLEKYQGRLNLLQRRAQKAHISSVLVFEGWDASGKGGAIRRVTSALDARSCQVIPIAAPTDEERARHYLWRFWRHLSPAGRITIFDRSWYGRVLVERVEGLAAEREWMRAYAEINQFEEQLVEHGIVLVKYWMHVTKDEQLRRFRERSHAPYKRWKLTDEDWRNRKKWRDYEHAVNDMVERTSTPLAPWTLVESNDKYFARLKVLKTFGDRLKEALGG